jgi:hypothetical protein
VNGRLITVLVALAALFAAGVLLLGGVLGSSTADDAAGDVLP